MTPTTRAINQLITDLDSGRANGTIYTYGQVQERLRAIVAAEEEGVVEWGVAYEGSGVYIRKGEDDARWVASRHGESHIYKRVVRKTPWVEVSA